MSESINSLLGSVPLVTFVKLRVPASRIVSLKTIDPSNADPVARDLRAISSILSDMPEPEMHLTDNLIATVLEATDRVFILCFGFKRVQYRFDFLIEPWCACLEFILGFPDGYRFMVRHGWKQVKVLLDLFFWAVDGIPEETNLDPGQARKLKQNQQQQPLLPRGDNMKRNRMSDDTRLAALKCLILLIPLGPHTPTMDIFPDETTSTATDNANNPIAFSGDRKVRTTADEEIRRHLLEPQGQDMIAQFIVILLDAAMDTALVTLRTTALEGVMKLLHCLETSSRVANWMPGISGGIIKLMLKRGIKEHHLVLTHCLHIWTYMVVLVLQGWQDEQSRSHKSTSTTTSDELMAMFKAKEAAGFPPKPDQPRGLVSEQWISLLVHSQQKLLEQVAMIRLHPHWKVRLEFAEMAFNIVKSCQQTILSGEQSSSTSAARILLETLIGATQDDYEQVAKPARIYLGLLAQQYKSQELSNMAKEILRTRLVSLPRILYGPDESLKQSSVRMVQGLALFLNQEMEFMVTYQTLWSYVQPWINVLRIEQLDRYNMDERGGILGIKAGALGAVSTAEEARWIAWTHIRSGSVRKFGFPRRIHLHLREQATSDAFLGFVRQVGASTDLNLWTDTLITRIQQDTRSVRDQEGWFEAGTVSAVLLMNHLLIGAANIGLSSFGDEPGQEPPTTEISQNKRIKAQSALRKKRQRQVRKTARGILEEYLEVLVECSQMSLDAKTREEADRRSRSRFFEENAQDGAATKKRATLSKLLTLDDEEIDLELPEARIYDYNADVMLRCLLLQGIASVAVVMGGTEFEMELIKVLYVLLEHLGDQSSALIRDTAHAALEHVAFVCNSESVGDLIQANYDYVIQQVSQRIAFLSSNPKTPQVLWALIHTVGMPAVSMLEDSVTEIFDALDHWRNKEDHVAEGLFKTLVEIVKVIAEASRSRLDRSDSNRKAQDTRSLDTPSSHLPSKEVAEFARVYRTMTGQAETPEDSTEIDPENELKMQTPEEIKEYFTKVLQDAKEREERRLGPQDDDDNEDDEDDEMMSFGELRSKMPKPAKEAKPEPPSKHEALSLRILNKAGYFLTASSPRMQILALEVIQNVIVILKDRPLELNPAVYSFWPQIVSRALQRSEQDKFFVGIHAIEVITALAENCSEFLGSHLRNDVWRSLLKAMEAWTRAPAPLNKDKNKTRTLGQSTYFNSSKRLVGAENRIQLEIENGPQDLQQQQEKHQVHRRQERRRITSKVFTKEHRLQMTILQSVSKIVAQVRIPFKDVWSMLLLARDAMLDRHWALHQDVRLAAAEVIKSVATAGHGDSVWLVLTAAMEEMQAIDEEDDSIPMCVDILDFMDKSHL